MVLCVKGGDEDEDGIERVIDTVSNDQVISGSQTNKK